MEANKTVSATVVPAVNLDGVQSPSSSILILVPISQESTSNNAKMWITTRCRDRKTNIPEIKTFFALDRAINALTKGSFSLVIISLSPSDDGRNRDVLTFLKEHSTGYSNTHFIVFGNERTLDGSTNTSNVTFSLSDHFGKTLGSVWNKLALT